MVEKMMKKKISSNPGKECAVIMALGLISSILAVIFAEEPIPAPVYFLINIITAVGSIGFGFMLGQKNVLDFFRDKKTEKKGESVKKEIQILITSNLDPNAFTKDPWTIIK